MSYLLDPSDLQTYVLICKYKNYSTVGNILNLSKSGVAGKVAKIEKTTGLNFLIRTTRKLDITPEGEIFLQHAKEILDKYEELYSYVETFGFDNLSVPLKIVLPYYFANRYVLKHIDNFCKQYPQINLELKLTEDIIDIYHHRYDIQIRRFDLNEANLETRFLAHDYKILCASKKYIENHGQPTNPEDLENFHCLTFDTKDWKFVHRETGKKSYIPIKNPYIHCNNDGVVKDLLLNSSGITLKSKIDIEDDIKKGNIIEVLPEYRVLNRSSFYGVYPKHKIPPKKTLLFLDYISNINDFETINQLNDNLEYEDEVFDSKDFY